jgi:Arylmalonate decarboxylase
VLLLSLTPIGFLGGLIGAWLGRRERLGRDSFDEVLEDDGFEVVAAHGMGMVDNAAIGRCAPERVAGFAAERFRDAELDLLFMSCPNLRALEARDRVEEELAAPAVTSNQAALEALGEVLDVLRPVTGRSGGEMPATVTSSDLVRQISTW